MNLRLLFLLLIGISFNTYQSLYAQEKIATAYISFYSESSTPSTRSENYLNNFIDSLTSIPNSFISGATIYGYTDSIGSAAYNQALSVRRAEAIKKIIIAKGILANNIVTKGFGSTQPIMPNNTEQGRASNRVAHIFFSVYTNQKQITIQEEEERSILDLYAQLAIPPQQYNIDPSIDNVIRGSKGSVILIKANTFPTGPCGKKSVVFHLKEDFEQSAMILDNLTTSSNGNALESQGMLFTEATDCKNQKLKINPGKQLVVMQPTNSVMPGAKVFTGSRTGHDSIMNWTVNTNSVLSNFSLQDLNLCNNFLCNCSGSEKIQCKSCRFFSCRIKRILPALKGLLDEDTHISNRLSRIDNRICKRSNSFLDYACGGGCCTKQDRRVIRLHRDLERKGRLIIRYNKKHPESPIINNDTALNTALMVATDSVNARNCNQLNELYKQYGVNNNEQLIYALNKQLMDSFGVNNLEALKACIKKANLKKIEQAYINKSLSFDDFKFYIYSTTDLGWTNIDRFSEYDKKDLVTMKVNLKPKSNIDCKLVFKNIRSILPAQSATDIENPTTPKYIFSGVPGKQPAYIMAIKYENGKPYLALQEITIAAKTYNVPFELETIESLREKLKILDNK